MFVMELAVLLFSLVQISASNSIASRVYSDDFVFPLERSDDFSSCSFENGTVGRCVTVSECPHARDEYQSGINPTLCHFEKVEPVVCCLWTTTTDLSDENQKNKTSEKLVERRKSAASCEDVYSIPVPMKTIPDELGEFHISVVGGELTLEEEFPHMAALGWTDDNKNVNWRCGGALISHDFVLTAAHCVIAGIPPDIVRIGEKDLSNTDAPPQDFGIALIIGHPEYRPRELYNDIALIKLSKRATITSKVRPACLWQGNAFNFTDVTATGYGHTEFGGKSSNELLKVDLTIFNNDECTLGYQNERLLKDGIVESQLCAGDSAGEKDTCQGDSGGPIQVSTTNGRKPVFHVVGVTSFGKACATTLPAVYTRVSHFLDWIESVVWS